MIIKDIIVCKKIFNLKKILLLVFMFTTFLNGIDIPLNDSQMQKVEQKLKDNSTDYTNYGFSNDEKTQYYKLMIFLEDMSKNLKNKDFVMTSEDVNLINGANSQFIELETKQYKAFKAEKKTRWSLFDYIKKEPNNIEKIKQLIKDGADVNVQDEEGYTPVYYSFIHNHEEIMKILINAKANPNIEDNDGYNLLSNVIYNKKYELLEWLLSNGGDANHKFEKLYQYKIKNKFDSSSRDYTLLHQVASSTNDPKFIQILIKAGANVNIKAPDNSTVLKYCADDLSVSGHMKKLGETVSKLSSLLNIEQSKDVEDKKTKEFRYPTYNSVKLLLDAGSKIDKKDLYLRYTTDLKTLKLLISKGANVNATDNSNETAIYTHITYGHFDVVKTLIEAGTNLNHKDNSGNTPLMACEIFGDDKRVCELIQNAMKK